MRLSLILLLMLFTANICIGEQTINLGTGLKPPLVSSDEQTGFLTAVATEAFKRINQNLNIIILPAGRVLINANKGLEDGCLLRIKGLEKRYPNLIRVPEKLMDSEFVGFSLLKMKIQNDWQTIKPFDVSYINGWQIFEKHLEDHRSVLKVAGPDQLFKVLKRNRTDIALYEKWQGLWMLKKHQIRSFG